MKIYFIKFNKFLVTISLLCSLSGCIQFEVKKAGEFREPVEYDNRQIAYIEIPGVAPGIRDEDDKKFISSEWKNGPNISFSYLGNCGGGISFTGIMVPIVPWIFFNKCEERDFVVAGKRYLEIIGVSIQLKYGNQIYEPYLDNVWVKFKIPNFSAFKNAKDKTLIIHKKKPDGTMWSKELPFDWKTVVEISGGL